MAAGSGDASGAGLAIASAAAVGVGAASDGPSEPAVRRHGFPRSLLRRVEEPPASPRTRARNRLLGLVVVPRTPSIQAAEDALSLALLALVLGTRPATTPAMMLQYLQDFYNVDGDSVTVRRTRPDDFIVRFTRREDLEHVLSSPPPVGAPFALRWRRWSRLIMRSSGAFRYRVLVVMKGLPSHALSTEVAQAILASSGAKAEIATPEAVNDPDDERELFVVAWCAHPDLVPDEVVMAIPEP
jgi:hypothetical protein